MQAISTTFWEETVLLDGFLQDIDSHNHTINPALLKKKSYSHTPPFSIICLFTLKGKFTQNEGSYLVVFWALSRMEKVQGKCGKPFWTYKR